MYSIDLNRIFLHGPIASWASPTKGGRVGSDASKANIRRFRYIDTKNINKFGYRFPEGLPSAMKEPIYEEEEKTLVSISNLSNLSNLNLAIHEEKPPNKTWLGAWAA
jgi:hypothetical protein